MCGGSKVDDDEVDSESKPKYGNPRKHDKSFTGPIKNRSCTDIICCLIFLFLVTAMIVISAVAYANGNPEKLLYPTDSSGHICGYDAGYVDKPNVVYFDIMKCAAMGPAVITSGCPTPQVCVKDCPNYYFSYMYSAALEQAASGPLPGERDKMICKDGVSKTTGDITPLVDSGNCAPYIIDSSSIIGRCVPSIFNDITDMTADLLVNSSDPNSALTTAGNDTTITGSLLEEGSKYLALVFEVKQYGEKVFKDVLASWWLILVCLAIAMVVCFIWIIIMRWIAGLMVWFSILALIGMGSFACYYSYTKYYELKSTETVTKEFGVSQAFALNFSYYLDLKETWLAFGCTSATLLALFLLILLFLIQRIRIAIELIKASSRAVGSMMFTLIWPVFPFVMQLGVVAYWAASAIYIASMGGSEYYSNSTTNTTDDGVNYYLKRAPCEPDASTLGKACEFVKYGGDEYTIPLEIFMLFMFLWLMNFVVALGQMTLAGAFASYYWAFEKPKDIPAFPLLAALYRSIRYHLGSLAFGSFIIAVVQLIRIFLEYLDQKLNGSENPVAQILLKCLKCCFWCLEKFLKFLNKNAYIMIAVYGRCFCFAAKDAFFLIMRNVVRTVVVDQVTDYLLFIGKLVVTGGVGCGAFFWFQGDINFFKEYVPALNYYLTPVIVVIIGTYFITCCFFSVYSMAVDTLFLCFLEDLEMNDGSPEKPYFMSKGLKKILGKSNKKLKEVVENGEESAAKGKKGKK